MLLEEGEHTEEAIMSQLTARGNLASDACFFLNEMSKTVLHSDHVWVMMELNP